MKHAMGWLVAVACVALAADLAVAGTVTKDGKTEPLKAGQTVTGPATVVGADPKDVITLRKGAVLQFLGADEDPKTKSKAESYFLKSGAADVNVGFYTRLSTPAFWAFPSGVGDRATFYAESFGVHVGYARAAKGSGTLRLIVDSKDPRYISEVLVQENQGVTLDRTNTNPARGVMVAFATDSHNDFRRGAIRVRYPLPTGLVIELSIPKATAGFMRPKVDQEGWTHVHNSVASWKSGKIRITTILNGVVQKTGDLPPGGDAYIDNASGDIQKEAVKIEFATLKAAVSLTSEFESLAASPIAKPHNP